jgi:predicted regulator of Ras-like GTPase activity (Roadblock/LC7/MglB family)
MAAVMKSIEDPKTANAAASMQLRMACQTVLSALVDTTPAMQFASLATVDGRSFAHVNAPMHEANPQRSAALMSSLLGLVESFSREALKSNALYNSTATEHGSIVLVRVPSAARMHTLCICSDASENLAMTIRAALDTASELAKIIDAPA